MLLNVFSGLWLRLLLACLSLLLPFQSLRGASTPFPEGDAVPQNRPDGRDFLVFAASEAQGTVDRLTGRYQLVLQDLAGWSGPTDLRLIRSLISPAVFPRSTQNLLGSSWRWNWECQLIQADRGILIADGAVLKRFNEADGTKSGTFRSADGETLILGKNQASLRRQDGTKDVFDEHGKLHTRTTRQTSFTLTYDSADRLTRIDSPNGGFVTIQYLDGDQIHVQNAVGETIVYHLRNKQLVRVEPLSGIATDYTYDQSKRLMQISHAPFGQLRLAYDAEGRLTARRWQDGSVERLSYEPGQTVRHVDRDGSVTLTRFDLQRGTAEITDPTGRQARLHFDRLGRLVRVENAQGEQTTFRYDNFGRLMELAGSDEQIVRLGYQDDGSIPTRMTGPNGIGYSFEQDEQGRLLRAQTGCLGETAFEYDSSGRVTKIQSSYAPALMLSYDSQGRIEGITNAAGHTSAVEYDERGNAIREVDAAGQVTTKSYDAAGRITSVTDPSGGTVRYRYTPSGLLAARSLANGTATRFDYTGRAVVMTNSAGAQTTYQYSPTGRLTEVISPLGHRSRFEYDCRGNLTGQTNPAGGTTLWEYNDRDQVMRVIDPTGERTEFIRDAAGNLLRIVDEQSEQERFHYDDQGVLQTSHLRDGTTIEWEPGPRGPRLSTIRQPDPSTEPWSYSYDAHGNLLRIVCGNQVILRCEYDELDRLIRRTNNRGLETRYVYDALDRLTAWQDSLGEAGRVEYDAAGRPVRLTLGEQTIRRSIYDRSGNLTVSMDALGHATRYQYNAAGKLVAVTTPLGERFEYTYDAEGRLLTAERGPKSTSAWEYDALDNVSVVQDALGRTWRARYDAAGRLTSQTDPQQRTTNFAYGPGGRIEQCKRSDGSIVRYEYDEAGHLTLVDDAQSPVRFLRDAHGRSTRIEFAAIRQSLHRQFDAEGRLAEVGVSSSHTVRYGYDSADRLTRILVSPDLSFHLEYDAKDRLIRLQYPNGVIGHRTYDTLGRIVSILYQNRAGDVLDGRFYEYDSLGRPVQVRSQSGTKVYGYDADDRLVSVTPQKGRSTHFAYGPRSNRQSRQVGTEIERYEFDLADQLIATDGADYEHDASGNLVRQVGKDTGATQYRYDVEGRLVKVILPTGKTVQFDYAATGVRIARHDDEGTTHFLSDGLRIWAEFDGEGNTMATFVHGPRIDQPLMVARNGRCFFLHADHLGSITAISDETGRIVCRYEYDPFGVPQTEPTGKPVQPFRFTGREWDSDLRLYYFRARYYDPALGRFLSPDPVEGNPLDPHSQNEYVYARNNPLTRTDPLGTQSAQVQGQQYVNSVLSEHGWGHADFNPDLAADGKATLGGWGKPTFGPHVKVQLGPRAAQGGTQQMLATRFHEAQHEVQAISSRWSRSGTSASRAALEQEAHWRTAEFTVRKGLRPEMTEQYIKKFGGHGGDTEQLRSHLQSLGYGKQPPGGWQLGTPLQAANAATRTSGIIGLMLSPANLVANYLENQSGTALTEEAILQAAGMAGGSLLIKTVGGYVGTAIAGTAAASAAPFVAATASVAAVAYGVDKTSTRLGEAVVKYEQSQMADTRVAQLNQLVGGDYLATISRQIDALSALRQQIQAAHSDLLSKKATAESGQAAANAGYQQLLQLKAQLQTAADPSLQAEALQIDAQQQADSCAELAGQVDARLDSVMAQAANIQSDEQAQQLRQAYQECLGQVRTIHAQAAAVTATNSELASLIAKAENQQQILSQMRGIVARIDQLASSAERTATSAQGGLQTIQQLKSQLDRQVAAIQLSMRRLEGIADTPAVRDSPLRNTLQGRFTALRGRLSSLESVSVDPQKPAQDATIAAQDARVTQRAALSLLTALEGSISDIEPADDAVAQADAAVQKANFALFMALSVPDRIAAWEKGQSADQDMDLADADETEEGLTNDDEVDISDLVDLVDEPPSDPPDDPPDVGDEATDVSDLFGMIGPTDSETDSVAGTNRPPSPPEVVDEDTESTEPESIAEYEGKYQLFSRSEKTGSYRPTSYSLDWRPDGEDRATITLDFLGQVSGKQAEEMRNMGLSLPLQLQARKNGQSYEVATNRALMAATEHTLRALAGIGDAIGRVARGFGSLGRDTAEESEVPQVKLETLNIFVVPEDSLLRLRIDLEVSIDSKSMKKTLHAVARPLGSTQP